MNISGKKKSSSAAMLSDDCVVKDASGNEMNNVIEAHIHIVAGEIPHIEMVKIVNFEKVKNDSQINTISVEFLENCIFKKC